MIITDCHVHIHPKHMFTPGAFAVMKGNRPDFDRIEEIWRSPRAFLKYLDENETERAVLINFVAPEVIGFTGEINQWVTEYCKADPSRLISCGSVKLPHNPNIEADIDELLRLGIRTFKIHSPHQLVFPNDYVHGRRELELLYRAAEVNGIPIVFHTGTSVFPGARNKYGDPMYLDDVAVDFPKLRILMAHGGRPLWMETAFFLLRRHPNVYLDISSIPPKSLLQYFPRLEEIADRTLFGTDWPGPGVPGIREEIDELCALPLSDAAKQHILSKSALQIWPA